MPKRVVQVVWAAIVLATLVAVADAFWREGRYAQERAPLVEAEP